MPTTVPVPITRHRQATLRVVLETGLAFFFLAGLANWLGPNTSISPVWGISYGIVALLQGILLQRMYLIAHEAAHKKLATNPTLNDLLGQVILLPMLVPLQVYRKIHQFHHGFNRRDIHTSALDVFVSPWPVTPLVKLGYTLIWYIGVFAGGYFLHSLVSIILFLFMPVELAQKISPAFKNWSGRDRLIAWGQFLSGAALHVATAWVFGLQTWAYTFGWPLLTFAWVWSLLVYIFHYRTTLGKETRYNARAIRAGRLMAWLFINFNQHATHHMYPNRPWHELPENAQELPEPFAARNNSHITYLQAILQQLRGPIVIYRGEPNSIPELFAHWKN